MADKTIVDAVRQEMRCEKCGDAVPIPLGAIPWVATVMQAFGEAHENCDGTPGRTSVSVPLKSEAERNAS